jgi:hypothetical protein
MEVTHDVIRTIKNIFFFTSEMSGFFLSFATHFGYICGCIRGWQRQTLSQPRAEFIIRLFCYTGKRDSLHSARAKQGDSKEMKDSNENQSQFIMSPPLLTSNFHLKFD